MKNISFQAVSNEIITTIDSGYNVYLNHCSELDHLDRLDFKDYLKGELTSGRLYDRLQIEFEECLNISPNSKDYQEAKIPNSGSGDLDTRAKSIAEAKWLERRFKELERIESHLGLRSSDSQENRKNKIELDHRISTDIPKEIMQRWFYNLAIDNPMSGQYKGQQILSQEDIDYFLRKTFTCFPKTAKRDQIYAKCNRDQLTQFIYIFYYYNKPHFNNDTPGRLSEIMLEVFENYKHRQIGTHKKSLSRKVKSTFIWQSLSAPIYKRNCEN